MDVNTLLHEVRELTNEAALYQGGDPVRGIDADARLAAIGLALAEKFDKIDAHMSAGGDRPDAWKETEDHR